MPLVRRHCSLWDLLRVRKEFFLVNFWPWRDDTKKKKLWRAFYRRNLFVQGILPCEQLLTVLERCLNRIQGQQIVASFWHLIVGFFDVLINIAEVIGSSLYLGDSLKGAYLRDALLLFTSFYGVVVDDTDWRERAIAIMFKGEW